MKETKIADVQNGVSRIELVEDYFDEHADYWSDAYTRPRQVGDLVLVDRKDIAVIYILEAVKSGGLLLDAGCGAGLATKDLLKNGYRVHAFDISRKMLETCKRNLEQANLMSGDVKVELGDVLQAGLADGTFDGIVALGFLQYQDDEHDALTRLAALLKPGGVLVISGPVKIKLTEYFGLSRLYYGIANLVRKVAPHPELKVLRKISTHYYGVGRFRRLLREAGFDMLKYEGHGFIHFAIIRDWTSRGQHFFYNFFKKAARVVPIGRFGNDMVVLARKRG